MLFYLDTSCAFLIIIEHVISADMCKKEVLEINHEFTFTLLTGPFETSIALTSISGG